MGEPRKVYGIAVASKMLETAYTRIAKKGLDSRVKVQIDDLVLLSFAAACFDAHF